MMASSGSRSPVWLLVVAAAERRCWAGSTGGCGGGFSIRSAPRSAKSADRGVRSAEKPWVCTRSALNQPLRLARMRLRAAGQMCSVGCCWPATTKNPWDIQAVLVAVGAASGPSPR